MKYLVTLSGPLQHERGRGGSTISEAVKNTLGLAFKRLQMDGEYPDEPNEVHAVIGRAAPVRRTIDQIDDEISEWMADRGMHELIEGFTFQQDAVVISVEAARELLELAQRYRPDLASVIMTSMHVSEAPL